MHLQPKGRIPSDDPSQNVLNHYNRSYLQDNTVPCIRMKDAWITLDYVDGYSPNTLLEGVG